MLALIVGNFVGGTQYKILRQLHILIPIQLRPARSAGRSVSLSVSNQVVRLISIKISNSGADNIELKKSCLPRFAAFCLVWCRINFAVVALLVKCRSRCHAHRYLHECVYECTVMQIHK